MVRASGATLPAGISGATRWDRAIFSQDFVAPRSCRLGYTSLVAPRPEKKSPTVAAAINYEIGSYSLSVKTLPLWVK